MKMNLKVNTETLDLRDENILREHILGRFDLTEFEIKTIIDTLRMQLSKSAFRPYILSIDNRLKIESSNEHFVQLTKRLSAGSDGFKILIIYLASAYNPIPPE